MKLEPRVNYLTLTDDDLTKMGLDGVKAHFLHLLARGRLNNDSLHTRLGMSPEYVQAGDIADRQHLIAESGQRAIGPDGAGFACNTGLDGKLGTVIKWDTDSDAAVIDVGLALVAAGDPNNPKSWTGGAYVLARVELDGVVYARKFADASSGVQGSHDLACSRTGAQDAAAAWMERVKARHAAGLSPILTDAGAVGINVRG